MWLAVDSDPGQWLGGVSSIAIPSHVDIIMSSEKDPAHLTCFSVTTVLQAWVTMLNEHVVNEPMIKVAGPKGSRI